MTLFDVNVLQPLWGRFLLISLFVTVGFLYIYYYYYKYLVDNLRNFRLI